MFNCKAVIFDMDGVIIDSEGLWREAQKGALARWGACVSDEECIRLTKGKGWMRLPKPGVNIVIYTLNPHCWKVRFAA